MQAMKTCLAEDGNSLNFNYCIKDDHLQHCISELPTSISVAFQFNGLY